MIKFKYFNKRLLIVVLLVFIAGVFFNKEVSIKQGINFDVHEVKMPLYVKILDFWTRHNHYKLLVDKITNGLKTDKEKLTAIFKWTTENIRDVPKGFPVYDDHVDYIIIRGYGSSDQSADVFTTLAVFSGFKAGMYLVKIFPERRVHAVSIVEVNNRFLIFDTFKGVYFENNDGDIASLSDIKNDLSIVKRSADKSGMNNIDNYARYFEKLKSVGVLGYSKADLQMLSKRISYIILRLFRVVGPSKVFYGETAG